MSATLDDVESYINDHPDSALSVLRSVDTTALHTRALRARYSLLRVMALDKCFEDITRLGLLDPAVNWYERHGSADERFKTCHYSGRIAQDRGDKMGAAMGYARAEMLSDKEKDRHALGLMYLAFGTLYHKSNYINLTNNGFSRADPETEATILADAPFLVFYRLNVRD